MAAARLALSFGCTPVREIHPHSTEESTASAVIAAVAELEGVEPTDLPALNQSIDPDAFDQLLAHERTDADSTMALCFTYCGWNVFVRGDGSAIIGDPVEMTEPTPLF